MEHRFDHNPSELVGYLVNMLKCRLVGRAAWTALEVQVDIIEGGFELIEMVMQSVQLHLTDHNAVTGQLSFGSMTTGLIGPLSMRASAVL